VPPLPGCPAQTNSKTKVGWIVRLGSEFALTPNVSINIETAYFDLGTARYNVDGLDADIQSRGLTSTVGLRLRFGGRPETAAVVRN
jgi:opacity protein-like surface antigen